MKSSCSVLIIAAIVLLVTSVGRGAILAFDNASQAAYDDGWQSGDNGGSGFGPWSFSDFGSGGIASSTANGDAQPPAGDIDSAGSRAWSLTHGRTVGSSFNATRPLMGNLAVGQHILFDADAVDTAGPNSNIFFAELDNATGSRWKFYVDEFGARLNDRPGTVHSATPEGFHIDFMLAGSDSYTMSINVLGEAPTILNGTLSGDIGSPIDRIRFSNVLNLGQDVFYANNLAVTPEPASPAFLVVGMCVAVGRRRRSVKPNSAI
jgi:hypothetical protein